MATTINRDTAIAIYNAIAVKTEATTGYVAGCLGLAPNTVRTYCRWLTKQGCIETCKSQVGSAYNSNVYIPIKPPPAPMPADERLAKIAAILEPFTRHPKSWDKATKASFVKAAQKATEVACS